MVNKDTVTISKVTKSPGKIKGPFFFINKYFFLLVSLLDRKL